MSAWTCSSCGLRVSGRKVRDQPGVRVRRQHYVHGALCPGSGQLVRYKNHGGRDSWNTTKCRPADAGDDGAVSA